MNPQLLPAVLSLLTLAAAPPSSSSCIVLQPQVGAMQVAVRRAWAGQPGFRAWDSRDDRLP